MMKTPDEIKKGIECCIKYLACVPTMDCCEYCPYIGSCSELKKDALSYIEQLEAKVPRWISVEERMPDESEGTVLVCFPDVSPYNLKEPFLNAKHDRRVATAKYSQHSKRWYIGDMCAVVDVNPTHWMPLPEPTVEV